MYDSKADHGDAALTNRGQRRINKMEVSFIFEKIQVEMNAGLNTLSERSQNLSQYDMITLAVITVIGLLFCFFGLKMVRIWAALFGFSVGFSGGAYLADYFNVSDNISLIIGLAAGCVLAVLGARFYLAGVFLVSWVMGIIGSAYFLRPADWAYALVCVGIGLVIALLTLKLAEPVTMVITALLGGAAAGQAIYGFLPAENEMIQIAVIAVLVILGVVIQFLMESKRRKRLHLKRAEEIRKEHSAANEVDKARAVLEDFDKETPSNQTEDDGDIQILDLDDDK